MNLETTRKAAILWRDLRKVEDKIEFFKQFVPREEDTRIFFFKKAKRPQLEICTSNASDDWSYFKMDDEMTSYVIGALEVKRDRLLKEIDAL